MQTLYYEAVQQRTEPRISLQPITPSPQWRLNDWRPGIEEDPLYKCQWRTKKKKKKEEKVGFLAGLWATAERTFERSSAVDYYKARDRERPTEGPFGSEEKGFTRALLPYKGEKIWVREGWEREREWKRQMSSYQRVLGFIFSSFPLSSESAPLFWNVIFWHQRRNIPRVSFFLPNLGFPLSLALSMTQMSLHDSRLLILNSLIHSANFFVCLSFLTLCFIFGTYFRTPCGSIHFLVSYKREISLIQSFFHLCTELKFNLWTSFNPKSPFLYSIPYPTATYKAHRNLETINHWWRHASWIDATSFALVQLSNCIANITQ